MNWCTPSRSGAARPAGPSAARVKALTPQRLRRSALRVTQQRVVHAPPPAADERFMNELRRRFKPEVEALSDYLGRDLVSLWGYDRID